VGVNRRATADVASARSGRLGLFRAVAGAAATAQLMQTPTRSIPQPVQLQLDL